MSQVIGQQQHHIDRARGSESLADQGTGVGRADGVQHVLSLETGRRHCLGLEFDADRRGSALALELQIDNAGNLAENTHDCVAGRIERVQVIAENLDGHLCRLAAQTLADAITQEGHDLALQARIARQDFAQLLLCIMLVDFCVRL